MGDKHLKTDNLKPLLTNIKRKVKKMKCYEMYFFYNDKGEIVDEEIIREITPKIIKYKHYNYSTPISKNTLNNQTILSKYNRYKYTKPFLSKNRTITRITPFSLSQNNIRRSPTNYNINKRFQTSTNLFPLNKYYSLINNKSKAASHTNDPVKIMNNDKQENTNKKNEYNNYQKNYIKTLTKSNFDKKTEIKNNEKIKNQLDLVSSSTISYNNNDNQIDEITSHENCLKVQAFAKSFNIINVQDWVHKNCFLVKLYIPNTTCSQINHFIDSCYNKKNI
uniref:Ras-associating domain-containing protein n=1 Tax=Strongyloides stercoralis TaxID=6248 RepID=A0A0K0EC83_STRER